MRTLIFTTALLFTTPLSAWGPGGYPGWYPGWGPGWGYGACCGGGYGYGMQGMGVIQTPSFNYTTTIIQSPPIIVSPRGEVLTPLPPRQVPNPYPDDLDYRH